MGFNMMVQSQNAAGLQNLQLFLVWDVMVQEALRGTMACLTVCFLWGNTDLPR